MRGIRVDSSYHSSIVLYVSLCHSLRLDSDSFLFAKVFRPSSYDMALPKSLKDCTMEYHDMHPYPMCSSCSTTACACIALAIHFRFATI